MRARGLAGRGDARTAGAHRALRVADRRDLGAGRRHRAAAARVSEARWQRDEARALEGVPVTLKENIATQGTPVPLGTAAPC